MLRAKVAEIGEGGVDMRGECDLTLDNVAEGNLQMKEKAHSRLGGQAPCCGVCLGGSATF